ncbi:MAG: hypothetical protein HY866_06720 [Chloroflexi bacterium]|nr:hypothetical protein [Chloroflexota bacterium]
MTALQRRLHSVYATRYTVWLLLALGVVRAVIFLIAYSPAHGADSSDYFLYAAQFKGLDAPNVFDQIYPLYPLLIYLTHYWLGSIYLLVGVQIVMSVLQGVLFYIGLRPYSPALGFVMALLVIGDAQTGILYNFISTEPPYMFVLSLAFCLFLIQIKKDRKLSKGDVVLGILLALILLIRPVGRYLIVPFAILFLLGTRAWWRTTVMVASYGLALMIFTIFNQIVFDQFELNGAGSFMLGRPLNHSGLLEADNGPASAQLLEMKANCESEENGNRCLIRQLGDWPEVRKLYSKAYREMLQEHPLDFGKQVFENFTDFLRFSGQQYQGQLTPSEVQCEDTNARAERETQLYIENDWLLYGKSEITAEQLTPVIRDIDSSMCPPFPDSWTVRRVVDWVSLHYRSLSRPHPYLWYGELGLLVLIIPWARRRLLIPVMLAGAIVANHAAASAVVLNVQPRYIVVVNPYKGFLLLAVFFIVGWIVLGIIDRWLARRVSLDQN